MTDPPGHELVCTATVCQLCGQLCLWAVTTTRPWERDRACRCGGAAHELTPLGTVTVGPLAPLT